MVIDPEHLIQQDRDFLWHPYSSMVNAPGVYPVESASGVRLRLADGRDLVDGMASWWSVIHGYNHPVLNKALKSQLEILPHVMFGGLTHEPAVRLGKKLIDLTPATLQTVFFSDSGSVAVEVAIKMALQYSVTRGLNKKKQLLTIRKGYHGDTFAAMSVCDPVTGMHNLFEGVLARHFFADSPRSRFDGEWNESDIESFEHLLHKHHHEIAAVILEPIVQGAGGMWFYSAEYLRRVRKLCDEYELLLILDEIATGFGRTGRLFACEYAGIDPDIMCLGKALTGGYMSMAATLCSRDVADVISDEGNGTFMHGPTFMANPLACAVANSSIELLLSGPWESRIQAIESQLRDELEPCRELPNVSDVRVLGAIGVVELTATVDLRTVTPAFVNRGVWVRPFGRLVYLMPPYIIERQDLTMLTSAILEVVRGYT